MNDGADATDFKPETLRMNPANKKHVGLIVICI